MARRYGASFGVVMSLGLSASSLGGQTLDDARLAVRSGEYRDAIRAFTRLARDGEVAAGRGLVRTLAEVGRDDDAEREARRLYASASLQFANVLGEVLYARGRLDEAEPLFREAARGATDSLTARLNLARVQYDRGELETAMAGFDEFIDVYNSGGELVAEELTAVATAARYLGIRDYQLFRDALRVYDEAFAVDPDDLEPRVRVGELFFARFNNTEATNTFREILGINPNHPRALLGMARSLHFDGKPEAMPTVGKSLEINENSVDARTFLARLHLELENYERAASEAERALEVDPSSPSAHAVIATIRFLQGDEAGYETARRRALQRNPRYAELYNTLAELSARNRLYQEAVDFARQAVAIDSQSWRGYGLLGMNQLRTGAIDEGRANLERYFSRDPYDPWAKNTLDLLDTFSDYRETSSPAGHFQLVMAMQESPLLQLYLADVADEAYERLAERYGYRPQTPIRLEVYPRHADFSVRTVGLAGLGALGVSFGNVLAMDSPSAREVGAFHWASTLWHEVAHTFHMTVSKHRVPRWFTEGLAVFEERRAHLGWGDDASVEFLMAYRDDRMPRVSELNNGFVRPEYPQQVVFSYYMASLVCELIQRDWGDQALVDMLEAYGAGQSNAEVFRSVLGMEPREFDSAFDRYMRERFTGPLTAVQSPHLEDLQRGMDLPALRRAADRREGDFPVQLETGRALVREGDFRNAIPYLERAKALFTEYAEGDSPYWYLALAYKGLGQLTPAAAELEALTAINAGHYHAYLEWAAALEQLGDMAQAAAVLDRALYVYPFDVDLHLRLAALYRDTEQWGRAIRERRAVLALDPVDRAEAEYQVALAYYQAGNLREARRSVLRALELAPNFEKGLDLLLDIRSARSQPDDRP
ncbi:MAG: tetratricopeptide repeat protein [Gemmatimonadetes bacterium]|nr:tetratricopeptide repeat protein [Gemmatimonadota bacterium]